MEFACSPRTCMGSLWVLGLRPVGPSSILTQNELLLCLPTCTSPPEVIDSKLKLMLTLPAIALKGDLRRNRSRLVNFSSYLPFLEELDKAGNLSDIRRSEDSYPDQRAPGAGENPEVLFPRRRVSSLSVPFDFHGSSYFTPFGPRRRS
ncbi:hypothetical protein ATANTOWER_010721 [Ataeniobius toweri]|uniref:Uncharacterized protein n=1 Tax=Ataeniobius toweri TaxID=208326 RepID=A0ABU7BPL2_9TELE|nr:hypothetical protein [Ataeniobius toweri]